MKTDRFFFRTNLFDFEQKGQSVFGKKKSLELIELLIRESGHKVKLVKSFMMFDV
jgi:hypothetical protein